MNKQEAIKKGVNILNKENGTLEKAPNLINVVTKEELTELLENLTLQYNQYNQESNEKRTHATKTLGAIELINILMEKVTVAEPLLVTEK